MKSGNKIVTRFYLTRRYRSYGESTGLLPDEALTLTEILENNGFEVVTVQCKTGAIPKGTIGIKPVICRVPRRQ